LSSGDVDLFFFFLITFIALYQKMLKIFGKKPTFSLIIHSFCNMKKIVIVLLASLAINQAAEAQSFFKKYKSKITSSTYKKVRGAKEQCIEEFRYNDTSSAGNGVLTLVNHTNYTYAGNRGSNGIKKSYNFFPDLASYRPDFDSALSDVNFPSGGDSALALQSYDAQDRILTQIFLSLDGGMIDTTTITRYTYTGTNTFADSTIINTPSQAPFGTSITVNKISSNRIDTAIQLINFGAGLLPVFTTSFLYDVNNNIIQETQKSEIFGSIDYSRTDYQYLSNSLLDSLAFFEGSSLVSLALTQTVGFNYNGSNSAGTWIGRDDMSIVDGFANFKLNAAKNVIEYVGYEVDNGDTVKSDSSIFVYTPFDNLTYYKQYGGDASGFNWQAVDSARYIYKPIIQAAINNTNSIYGLSILPTKVTNTAYVHYQTTQMQKANLTITNINGVVLHQQSLSALNGNTIVPVDVSNFANGIYNATIISEDGSKASIRFVN
jgi:hypothetical protein